MGWFRAPIKYRIIRRRVTLKGRRVDYLLHRERARTIALERVRHFDVVYGVHIKKIAIKNLKTRWGSCSKKGNLNFHYKLALLSPSLVDYLVVHEVCHLREFNHSKQFWDLVAQQVPDYRALRAQLKKL